MEIDTATSTVVPSLSSNDADTTWQPWRSSERRPPVSADVTACLVGQARSNRYSNGREDPTTQLMPVDPAISMRLVKRTWSRAQIRGPDRSGSFTTFRDHVNVVQAVM